MAEPRATPAPKVRDPRLDAIRGLCLVMIFLNHVPGTVYETLTSRNFGFSDAAEGFVIMSGIAAGLAYSAAFRTPPFLWGLGRVWRRVWTLYLVQILCTVLAVAVCSAAALWLGDDYLLFKNNLDVLFEKPLSFLVGVPLLTHQLGYTNILPLYAVLLAGTPFALMLAHRRPRLLLGLAVAGWVAAGQFRLNLPNFPNSGGWFFNPLAWQLIFVVGLLTGTAMKRGERFLPVRRGWLALAIAYLVLALAVSKIPAVSAAFGHTLWLGGEAGLPFYLVAFDKTFLTLPRLLHILALAYVLASWPAVRQVAGARWVAPLSLLGRQALPVFALGTVLCFAVQAIKHVLPPSFAVDTALIGAGLGLQLALAWAREAWKSVPAPARA